ncbi:hypothetical protein MMC26_004896 [Xylographa opegraphella]|nr:hypothetical protein [Xylographa opegraphella]
MTSSSTPVTFPLIAKFDKDFRPTVSLAQSDAEAKLRDEEVSIEPPEELGVSRYDVVRVPSNFPTEDDLIHGAVTIPGHEGEKERTIMFWGVFDGHEGWEMSTKLRVSLMEYVSRELKSAFQTPSSETSEDAISKAIEIAFERLDDDVMNAGAAAVKASLPLSEALSDLTLTYAGSCALLGIYDPFSCLLRVACVGDSRAVLGQRKEDGKWQTIALSADQNLDNESEASRLHAEHPNEPDMIEDNTVLGMYITRAFGNGRWKYSTEIQKLMKDNYFARSPRSASLTPPYLTAKPVVSMTEVQPGKDFMILASDGLWNRMNSEQAVLLVGKWLDKKSSPETSKADAPKQSPYSQRIGSDVPPRSQMTAWEVHAESIIVVDDNAATHLARNALGGADEELFRGMLTFRAPFSRNIRDDITVQVVFFGSRTAGP